MSYATNCSLFSAIGTMFMVRKYSLSMSRISFYILRSYMQPQFIRRVYCRLFHSYSCLLPSVPHSNIVEQTTFFHYWNWRLRASTRNSVWCNVGIFGDVCVIYCFRNTGGEARTPRERHYEVELWSGTKPWNPELSNRSPRPTFVSWRGYIHVRRSLHMTRAVGKAEK